MVRNENESSMSICVKWSFSTFRHQLLRRLSGVGDGGAKGEREGEDGSERWHQVWVFSRNIGIFILQSKFRHEWSWMSEQYLWSFSPHPERCSGMEVDLIGRDWWGLLRTKKTTPLRAFDHHEVNQLCENIRCSIHAQSPCHLRCWGNVRLLVGDLSPKAAFMDVSTLTDADIVVP